LVLLVVAKLRETTASVFDGRNEVGMTAT